MRNHLMLSTASRATFAKAHEGEGAGNQPKVETPAKVDLGVTKVTIAGIDVELPNKFGAGHVLSEVEAKVLDSAFRRQFANNQNAAFKAWEEKAKKWDESTATDKGERPVNPCSDEAMLAAYVAYVPNVGAAGQTQAEKDRYAAGLRAVTELFEEHNAARAAGNPKGTLGLEVDLGFLRTNKAAGVTAEKVQAHKDGWVNKVLASAKQADRVQRHLDAILAERGSAKPQGEVATVSADDLDI